MSREFSFPPVSDILYSGKGMGHLTDKLAENIRAFRKQRALTQEQLAEVLGVTVGAVYKWEAKLSLPELSTILELADFFDTSVDVLLGYELRDNRLQTTLDRLRQYRLEKDRAGLAEAEKALKKYPHMFSVVYAAAELYRVFGVQYNDKALMRRAIELLENARRLLPQNTDAKISESTISGDIAQLLLSLGETAQAVDLLRRLNAGGIYSDVIGLTLASDCKQTEEALPYLSEALANIVSGLVRVVMGYINVYFAQNDYASAQAVLLWGIGVLSGLKKGEKPGFLDKLNAVLFVCLANARQRAGDAAGAKDALCRAKTLAEGFDAAPDYRVETMRFASGAIQASAYDDLGMTAAESVEKAVAQTEDGTLAAYWEELMNHEG